MHSHVSITIVQNIEFQTFYIQSNWANNIRYILYVTRKFKRGDPGIMVRSGIRVSKFQSDWTSKFTYEIWNHRV